MNLYPPQRIEASASPFILGSTCDYRISKGISEETALISKFYDGSLNTRDGILKLQDILLAINPDGKDPFPLFHTFSEGLYTREMHCPKGVLIIGQIHRFEHLVKLDKSKILIADEFGTRTLEAPATFVSKPGVKRVGYTLEDVVWTDIYKTECKTVEDAEHEQYVETYEQYMKENNILETSWQA